MADKNAEDSLGSLVMGSVDVYYNSQQAVNINIHNDINVYIDKSLEGRSDVRNYNLHEKLFVLNYMA